MRIGLELWRAAKRAERGYQGQGPETLLSLCASPSPGAPRKKLAEDLRHLGASNLAQTRNGRVTCRLPASRVVFLAGLEGLAVADLVGTAGKSRGKKSRWWALAALLVLAVCSLAAVRFAGQGDWRVLWQKVWAWVEPGGVIRRPKPKPLLPGEDDGVPRRVKPKPARPGEVLKRVKPKPALPGGAETPTVKGLYHQGLVAYHAGDKKRAVELWQKALSLDPEVLGVRRNLGWALYEMGEKAGAVEQFKLILKKHPADEEARAALLIIERDGDRSEHNPSKPPVGGP